jgi:hypothetical protein
MDYRNPVFNAFGTIDCEIEHPRFGWIPFTCDPNDTGAAFDPAELFETMQPNAAPFVPVPPLPPTKEEQEAKRQAAFQIEADPLFFKWQAGEGTEAAWSAKRDDIRARYPYPEE